jgi:hypothetical protein
MVQDIVFHLGDTKTGSTSIQKTLAATGWRGGGRSVFYPKTPLRQKRLAYCLSRPNERRNEASYWGEMATLMRQESADIGVISAEAFEFIDPHEMARAIRTHMPEYADRVRLIAYVRPHVERLASTYAERVKQGGFSGSMADLHAHHIDKGRLMYAPRFAAWRDAFGAAYTLRPMIRTGLKDKDVVADFLDWLFQGAAVTVGKQVAANEALSVSELAALRTVHAAIRSSARADGVSGSPAMLHKDLGWKLATALNALREGGTPEKPRVHRALAERLVKDYRADAEALDAAFFEGTPMTDALRAAPGKAPEAEQVFDAAAHFSPEAVRLIQAIGEVTGRALRDDPRFDPGAPGRVPGAGKGGAGKSGAGKGGAGKGGRKGGGKGGRKGGGAGKARKAG